MTLLNQINANDIDWVKLSPTYIFEQYEQSIAPFIFDDTKSILKQYDEFLNVYKQQYLVIQHLSLVLPQDGYADIYTEIQGLYEKQMTELHNNQLLIDNVNSCVPQTEAQHRMRDIIIQRIKEYNPEVVALNLELNKLKNQFAKNLSADQELNILQLPYSDELVDGLPSDFVHDIRQGDKIVLKTTKNHQNLVFENSNSQILLENYYLFIQNRCKQNEQVVKAQLICKQKISEKLGFKTIADKVLSSKMIQTSKALNSFMCELQQKMQQKLEQDKIKVIYDYQIECYNMCNAFEKTKQKICGINPDEIKKGFPLQQTISKILNFISQLLNIKMEKLNISTWHQDVECYKIYIRDREPVKIFFDLFERRGKVGAWFQRLSPRQFSVQATFANDEYLQYNSVATLFHELGHTFHAIYSNTEFYSLNAIDVQWDFVEVPSQFFEQYAYQFDVLKNISNLSDDQIKKLLHSLSQMNGFQLVNQLYMSQLDITLHEQLTTNNAKEMLIKFLYHNQQITQQYNSFSHLFGQNYDYTVQYYSYFYSEVQAIHLFEYYRNKNINELIQKIFVRGNEVEAAQLMKQCCGDWDATAFYKFYNI